MKCKQVFKIMNLSMLEKYCEYVVDFTDLLLVHDLLYAKKCSILSLLIIWTLLQTFIDSLGYFIYVHTT